MSTAFNPYQLTIIKLNNIKNVLINAVKTGNFDHVESAIALLRTYKDCYFCQAYRTQLEGNSKGTCDACPCHQIGEQRIGRKRSYNGCYVTGAYREMVRLAWWMEKEKSIDSATALIKVIGEVILDMQSERVLLDKEIRIQ